METKWSKTLFYIAWTAELLLMLADASDYSVPYDGWCFRGTLLLFGLSILTARHTRREWCVIAAGWVFGLICWRFSGRLEMLRLITILFACRDLELKKALNYTFAVTAVGAGLIIILSVAGFFGTVSITQEFGGTKGYRMLPALGFGHPNTLEWAGLMLAAMTVYLFHRRLRIVGHAILFAAFVLFSLYTRSRSGLICGSWMILASAVLQLISPGAASAGAPETASGAAAKTEPAGGRGPVSRRIKNPDSLIGAVLSVLILAGSIGMSLFGAAVSHHTGTEGWEWLDRLDRYFSGRITNLYWGTQTHRGALDSWKLFSDRAYDNFFDMGWVRVFFWYGIIPGILILALILLVVYGIYRKGEASEQAVLSALVLYTLFEALLVTKYLGRNFMILPAGYYLWSLSGSLPARHRV